MLWVVERWSTKRWGAGGRFEPAYHRAYAPKAYMPGRPPAPEGLQMRVLDQDLAGGGASVTDVATGALLRLAALFQLHAERLRALRDAERDPVRRARIHRVQWVWTHAAHRVRAVGTDRARRWTVPFLLRSADCPVTGEAHRAAAELLAAVLSALEPESASRTDPCGTAPVSRASARARR